jgi:hypothetical protein
MQIKRTARRIQARIYAAESIENAAEFAARPSSNEGAIGAREDATAAAKSPQSKFKMFGFQGVEKPDATAPSNPQGVGRALAGKKALLAKG